MKVLLIKNVKGLGNAGQLVDVQQGFAINHLIPAGLVKIPTVEEEIKAETFVPKNTKDSAEFTEWAKMAVAKLAGKTLSFTGKASEKGHLFGSITEKDIAAKINDEYDIEIDTDQIHIAKHIKDLGDNRVEIVISPEYHAALTVRVEAE